MELDGYRLIESVAVSFVNAMKIGSEPGVYRKDPIETKPSWYGSYHAAHILDLFRKFSTYSKHDIDSWAALINEKQCDQGYYSNNVQDMSRIRTIDELDPIWHFTRGMIWTLRVLGRRPKHEFAFLEPLLNKKNLYGYVKHYDWSNSWATSNQICALGTALLALRDWYGISYVNELLEDAMFPALEELIDAKTGFWGCQYGASLDNGLFGTIHILPIYFAQGWEYRFVEKSIDSTLACQYPNGSFWPCGSDCPDFDGAYMIYNLYQLTDYRKEDLEVAAHHYLDHALHHISPDKIGFLIHRYDCTSDQWVSRPHFIWEEGKHTPTQELRDEDPKHIKIMLGSWFYPLSIALVSHIPSVKGYQGPYKLTPMSLHECNVVQWDK